MHVDLTRSEVWVGGFPFLRAVLLPEIGIKAYRRSYPQKTTEAKIEAYKQPSKQKLNFDPIPVASDFLLSH